ncbi:transcription-repair coupling factor [Aureimonas sp. AU40]|uniref:transcription-repair coupling factor n=1 Tax=Aureimonas sp. AU40 TaxID=1637747 RepID=UPI000782592A|nr:helicase-related protein [Aureimonas sp. AU40]
MLQSVTVETQASNVDALTPLHPLGATAALIRDRAAEIKTRPLVYVAQTVRRAKELMAILEAFDPGRPMAFFPPWDCLPYDGSSPSRSVMGQRMGVLRWLTNRDNKPDIVLTTGEALLHRVPPARIWSGLHREFRVGDPIDIGEVEAFLRGVGYVFDDRVDEPGEAAIRGRVIDFFPAASPLPCRIEHEEGRVTAIRSYDPVTQRTLASSDMLIVDPASEVPGAAPPPGGESVGREHWLCQHYEGGLETVFDYVGDAAILLEDGVDLRVSSFLETVATGFEEASQSKNRHRPPKPERMYLGADEWQAMVGGRLDATINEDAGDDDFELPRFAAEDAPWRALDGLLSEEAAGSTVILAAPNAALLAEWSRRFRRNLGRPVKLGATWDGAMKAKPGASLGLVLPVSQGFRVPGHKALVVTVQDIGGLAAVASRADRASPLVPADAMFSIGDALVHLDHGIGLLEGLSEVEQDGTKRDTIRLRYADDATLLVPVREVGALWRYGGAGTGVTLDKLKGGNWIERRNKLLQAVHATAEGLVAMAREKAERRCAPSKPDRRDFERFCGRFPHELSDDQALAVDTVLSDLASGKPMDRLVCGDVGFGKTEVALRAAAAVAFSGRQVAIVAPTTVLAQQHARTVARRFANFGIEVAQLSRLSTPAEAKRVKAGLADGSIRVVVGTHAVGGKGVRFADLGLMVIDEEQRFGAKQKATLRALGEDAHLLTLTATPIPRTLQASFVGLNDLSIVATPPVLRQPIQTVVAPFEDDRVRDALYREKRRGGQSFVVCPRVEDIEPMRARLQRIAPDLQFAVVHGQLPADEVDETMLGFTEGQGDVLLATNIIESGLDVPAANTMIVWHPDRFGLAQLHQLRGRVGRGSRRGVAYLLTEPGRPLPPETDRRLRTLEALNRLGAGFEISARDMDLRGAGELLGEEQAGHLQFVGLALYRHVLQRALAVAKGASVIDEWMPEVALGVAGRIPDDYVPDEETRINLYAEIDRARDRASLGALASDIEDRFGKPPAPARTLLMLAEARVRCAELGIAKLAAGPKGVAATFRTKPDAEGARTRKLPADWKWTDMKLVYPVATASVAERFEAATALFDRVDPAEE